MSMISFVFIGFVAVVFIILYIVDNKVKSQEKSRFISNAVLLAFSYLFIAYVDWRFAVVMAFITIVTWFFAKREETVKGIAVDLAVLLYFKYTNFFVESIARLFGQDYTALKILLPIGISFYIFSAIGYLVDVKRHKIKPQSLFSVALYLSFFPKLTSGPIQKSNDFFKQMTAKRCVGWCSFEIGIQTFMFGLFKKLVLADRLSVFVNQVYATPKVFGSLTVFMAAVAYSLQIYFDFSGYSDMAVGVAQILGFEMPRNFNLPYLSHNVTEFWKRWHITLSTWLQEYLYFSLGGNRKGTVRTYINLILTMLIGGLWHGPNWTYVIWGVLNGVALSIHKGWMAFMKSDKKEPTMIESIISIITTFLFTTFCWIFFRADSIQHALQIIRRILSFESGLEQPYLWLFISCLILIMSIMIAYKKTGNIVRTGKKKNVSVINGYYPLVNLTTMKGLITFFVFCGLILCLAYTGGSPFIYGKY